MPERTGAKVRETANRHGVDEVVSFAGEGADGPVDLALLHIPNHDAPLASTYFEQEEGPPAESMEGASGNGRKLRQEIPGETLRIDVAVLGRSREENPCCCGRKMVVCVTEGTMGW